jgi:hypothetical protein
MARADGLVGRLRGQARIPGIDFDEGLQMGVLRRYAGEQGLDRIDGRKPARPVGGGELRRAVLAWVRGHWSTAQRNESF